jgi:hypothetical protein
MDQKKSLGIAIDEIDTYFNKNPWKVALTASENLVMVIVRHRARLESPGDPAVDFFMPPCNNRTLILFHVSR